VFPFQCKRRTKTRLDYW